MPTRWKSKKFLDFQQKKNKTKANLRTFRNATSARAAFFSFTTRVCGEGMQETGDLAHAQQTLDDACEAAVREEDGAG